MAEFTITLLRPADNHETTVYYDNMTNELRWKDGRPIIDPAPEPQKWGEAFAVSKETPGEKADVKTLVKEFTAVKRAWYISLHQPKFTKGWLNRCDHVAANALTLI